MKKLVLETCKLMLAPVARLLLRAGIGFKEFEEAAKQVFVDVARRDYGIQGRPTNSARVALMTGLSRREVARIRKILIGHIEDGTSGNSRLSAVLTGWHVDPDFTDGSGAPAVLKSAGPDRSFARLLDRYAGDIPHGALTKELVQLGLVAKSEDGYRVLSRDYIRATTDPDRLRQGGRAIYDHAATVLHNIAEDSPSPARFERMATETDMSLPAAAAFQELLADKGQAFLEQIDAWLAATKASQEPRARKRARVRTGVGMYLIYDEKTGNQDNE